MKKLRITVDGKAYEVVVEMLDAAGNPVAAPASAAVPPPAPPVIVASASIAPAPAAAPAPAPAASGSSPGDVPSPLSGKIVSIDVKVGQKVAEGDQVVTVEAMKMNTYVTAHKAGTVEAIFVQPGDGVDEGRALLRIA